MKRLFSIMPLIGILACRDSRRIDAATLEQTASGLRLRVAILGTPADPRIPPIRETIAHWNAEFLRLGRHVQLDSGIILNRAVPDEVLRGASGEAMFAHVRTPSPVPTRSLQVGYRPFLPIYGI